MGPESKRTAEAAGESYPDLISLAVHEFRTPVSVVGGYLRMLQRDTDPLSDRQRKMIDEAAKSCARLVEMVSELSEVGKLDSGRTAVAAGQAFDLFALVRELAESVHEAGGREVRLTAQGQAAGAPMTGDATRLRSAIHAIMRAILRELPSDRRAVADCRVVDRDGRRAAVIVVADAEGVLDAYERPRAVFDDKRGGLGLALPIARRVIHAHGGAIWAPIETQTDAAARGAAVIVIPLE